MRYRNVLPGVAVAVLGVTSLAAGTISADAATTMDVLYSFCGQAGCPDGDQPYAGVTLLSSGTLLGTTGFGGKYNGGTVFTLDEKKRKLKTLQSICAGTPPSCQPDEGPSVTLVVDTKGDIFGTVYFGGANGDGAVFELESKGGKKYKLHYLHSFDSTDGDGPWDLSYAGQNTGAHYDGKSPLYGATLTGGTTGNGTVYSMTPGKGGWNFQTLYNFCSADNCTDGGLPRGAVLADSSGALYGTTGYYGADNAGTIYKLAQTKGAWSETTLYTFCNQGGSCVDGNGPFAGVAEDGSGNLFGTTYFGGNENDGVVYELTGGGKYSVLYSFCPQAGCSDGSEPLAGVTLDASGNIFGTTSRGGDGNYGAMFEIAKGKYQRLYSYCSQARCSDGGYPYGTLALDGKGDIYGTTQYGGGNGLGEVYELKK